MFLLFSVQLLLSVVSVYSFNNNLPTPDLYEVRVFDGELHQSVLDPKLCQEHLQEMSSFEFYDASFRVPQGILTGNLLHYGNYHQCLAIDQELTDASHIRGKHCMITIDNLSVNLLETLGFTRDGRENLPVNLLETMGEARNGRKKMNVTDDLVKVMEKLKAYESLGSQVGRNVVPSSISGIRLGICVPASCTPNDVLDRYVGNQELVDVDYTTSLCRLPGDKPRVAADYAAIALFSLLGLVTIMSTVYDVRHTVVLKKDPKQLSKLYSCASVYTNTRRLFTFRETPGALTCLDGIRSLSIMWIICAHTVMNMSFGGVENQLRLFEWYYSWEGLWVVAADIAVDTFFMLSGLLLVYTAANKLTQVGLIKNLHMFYLNRLLRMFPILAAAVLLQASFLNRIADGANWDYQGNYVEYCRRHWWAALLHIQNYYNAAQMCLPHTWYLAVDVQLHIISPIVLFWILGSRKSGWIGVSIVTLLSITASTVYIFLIVSKPENLRRIYFYYNTLTRAPVFFVGVIFGYILSNLRGKRLRLSPWQVALGWLASIFCIGVSIYAYYPGPGKQSWEVDWELYDQLFDSFSKIIWGAGIGWVVLACVHGYGGPVNWFLSLTVFRFLARISYAMYILHQPIQFVWASAVITTYYFSLPNVLLLFLNDAAMTIGASIAITVLVDAPFSTLQKMLLERSMPKPKPKEPTLQTKAPGDLVWGRDIAKL